MEKQNTKEQKKKKEWMMMEIRLHMKKKEEDKAIKSNCNAMKVKLPKLVIITFNGTHID